MSHRKQRSTASHEVDQLTGNRAQQWGLGRALGLKRQGSKHWAKSQALRDPEGLDQPPAVPQAAIVPALLSAIAHPPSPLVPLVTSLPKSYPGIRTNLSSYLGFKKRSSQQ